MSPTIQILPPVGQTVRDGSTAAAGDAAGHGPGSQRGSLGALVRLAGWQADLRPSAPPTASRFARAPLFSHAGAPDQPRPSLGFLAQHLAQEWSTADNYVDPARAAAAYAAPGEAVPPGIEIRAAA